MRFKKLTSAVVAAVVAATCITTSQVVFADATFASASDFITDVISTSLADIESTTKDDAIATMQGKLTTSGDAVLYDGATIGYWYTDDSTTLYVDEAKTDVLFKKSVTGYEVDPDLMKILLTDINDNLVDTYTPTTSDWSKIIGKYDVTLGDITIPANQWVKAEYETDKDPLLNGKSVNISRLTGIKSTGLGSQWTDTNLYICSWLIDDTGKLYLQNQILTYFIYTGNYKGTGDTLSSASPYTAGTSGKPNAATLDLTFSSNSSPSSEPLIKAGIINYDTSLYTRVYVTDATHTVYHCTSSDSDLGGYSETNAKLCNIDDPAIINTCSLENAKAYGVVYFTGAQIPSATSNSTFNSQHDKMFTSNSASRQVTGNTILTKRLAKFAALEDTDILTITPTSWLVNGTDIDTFMSTQNMLTAGETADISAVAEIEPLCFNVVVPTTLPIYVATDGTVTTATNATVTNKSNAAVRITDINITAKPECGWLLVDDAPSDVRDAKEFAFETSLAANQVLQRDEVLPFSYNVELSPMTLGDDNLDLATVSVTVDWAD